MRVFLLLFLFSIQTIHAQDQFQLAPPLFKYSSVFFIDEMEVELAFAKDDAQIFFTLNGENPTEKDQLYSKPIVVNGKLTTIKARVFSESYLPSEVSEATFIKQGYAIKQMTLSKPNDKYSGSGFDVLFDNRGGITDHTSKTWSGYDQNTITCEVKLSKHQKVDTVLLNVLENPGAWIFAPTAVEVFAIDKKTKKLKSITKESIQPTSKGVVGCRVLVIPFKEIQTDTLLISIRSVTSIPDWHPGAGNQGWLFIDEIKVY